MKKPKRAKRKTTQPVEVFKVELVVYNDEVDAELQFHTRADVESSLDDLFRGIKEWEHVWVAAKG